MKQTSNSLSPHYFCVAKFKSPETPWLSEFMQVKPVIPLIADE